MRSTPLAKAFSLSCVVLLLASATARGEPSVNIPLTHWAYDFLDRLEAKRLVSGIRNGTKPLTRHQVAQTLIQCRTSGAYQPLSPVDQQRFNQLEEELFYELSRLQAGNQPRKRAHLYQLRSHDSAFFFDPTLRYRWIRQGDANIVRWNQRHRSNGGIAYGYISKYAAFYANIRDNRRWGADEEDLIASQSPERGVPLYDLGTADTTTFDYYEPESYLSLSLPWTDVMLGIDSNIWGPGYTGSLGLSSNTPSYPQIKVWGIFFGRATFTWLHASLDSGVIDSLRTYVEQEPYERTVYRPKYLAAHRLEVTLKDGLDVGLYESMIYGEANAALALMYWFPLTFLVGTEGLTRNTGNKQLGLDVDVNLVPDLKLYGALHIDDLSLERMFDDDSVNLVGFQLGALYVDPAGLRDLDLRLEYTRINPWVYDHQFRACNFYSYDSVLGYWLEMNGDDLLAEARYRPHAAVNLSAYFERRRKGEGELGDYHHYAPPAEPFLFGQVEKRHIWGLKCAFEPFRDFWIKAAYRYTDASNVLAEAEDRREDRTEHVFELDIGYNYW